MHVCWGNVYLIQWMFHVFFLSSRVNLCSNPCFIQEVGEIMYFSIWCKCSPSFASQWMCLHQPPQLVLTGIPVVFRAEKFPAEELGIVGWSLDFRSGLFGFRSKTSDQTALESCSCSSCFKWQGTRHTRHLVHPICTGEEEICPVAVRSVCFGIHGGVQIYSSQSFRILCLISYSSNQIQQFPW